MQNSAEHAATATTPLNSPVIAGTGQRGLCIKATCVNESNTSVCNNPIGTNNRSIVHLATATAASTSKATSERDRPDGCTESSGRAMHGNGRSVPCGLDSSSTHALFAAFAVGALAVIAALALGAALRHLLHVSLGAVDHYCRAIVLKRQGKKVSYVRVVELFAFKYFVRRIAVERGSDTQWDGGRERAGYVLAWNSFYCAF